MASAAEIGATGSSYTGDAALGGFGLGFGKIDTRPLEDLARYSFLYNKAEYDQRQKDADAKAKELAAALDYDLTSSIPKDAKKLRENYDSLVKYLRDNPDAVDYRNPEKWIELKTRRNHLKDDITAAGARNTMNLLRQQEVDETTEPEIKQYYQDKLNQEIEATDIRTPLRHSAKYDLAPVPIKPARTRKFGVTAVGSNMIGTADWEVLDQSDVANVASSLSTGLANLTDFMQQPSFKALPPQAQQAVIERYKAQRGSGKLLPVRMAEDFNAAIQNSPEFWTATPDGKKVVNMDALLNSNNGIIRTVAEQIQRYNENMDKMVGYIKGGYFKDNFSGEPIHFGTDASGLNERDYKKIDLTDQLQPEEILKMQIWGASPTQANRKIDPTITDFDLKRRKLNLDWATANKEKKTAFIGADSVMKEMSEAVNSGQDFTRTFTVTRPNGKKELVTEKVRVISEPNLIKEFATIDKDGKEINRPDEVVYSPRGNDLTLTYYKRAEKVREHKKDKDGKDIADEFVDPENWIYPPGSNIGPDGYLLNSRGERIVADEKRINARQWMGQIVKRKFSADDMGQVNNFANELYDKIGEGNLLKLAQQYKAGATGGTQQKDAPQSATSAKTKTTATTELSTSPQDWTKEGNYWRYKDGTLYDDNGNKVKK